MTQKMIINFNEQAPLEIVGGKALNLMRLTRCGMPVTEGFTISTAAYQAFVDFNHLDEPLSAAFAAPAPGQAPAGPSAGIRAAFERGEFPAELAAQIATAYQRLGQSAGRMDLAVAVRSSATAEDLAEASFAGQQDTYLNVRGESDLLAAIRSCFGSLWSERAIDYRARQGLAPLAARLAVVIQQMVFADAAGVAFTADPFSGDANCMVIDATYGLGEALVSGLVTPDHVLVDKRSAAELNYAISDKTERIVPLANGTRSEPVPRQKRRARVLAKKQVGELLRIGLAIEKEYGRPLDLEWCLERGRVYIVQARAITTLPERPVTWDAPGEGRWLHGGGFFEMITEPISPLFETFLLPIFAGAVIKMVEEAGLKGALPGVPYQVVNGHIFVHVEPRLRPWHLAGVIKDFSMHLNSMDLQEGESRLYLETVASHCQPAAAELSNEQILARLQALGEAGMRYWVQIMKLVQVIYRQEKAFTDFYQRRACRPGDPRPEIFLRGQKIKPWEAECATFDLAQWARRHPGVADVLRANPEDALTALAATPDGVEFNRALEGHLDRYGHQLSSFDLCLPTLADDPRPVLAALQAFLQDKELPYARQQRMAQEREQAVAAVTGRLAQRDRLKFMRLLETAQAAGRLREDSLFDVGLAWTHMRRCAVELGRRLQRSEAIERAEDVFWLTLDEIRAGLAAPAAFKARVSERQGDSQAWGKVSAPYLLPQGSRPAFWWGWVFPTPELQRHPNAHTLVGLGVSPGKVTGIARVIHSLDEMAQLNPGEILVAHTTTPAWTPLFARAAGLVTDLGGPLAHGSIIAREVGIPAVMGTGSATRKIHSGQEITVLGSEGKVTW